MKKIVAVVFVVILAFSFIGCSPSKTTIKGILGELSYSEIEFKIGLNPEVEYIKMTELQVEAFKEFLETRVSSKMTPLNDLPEPGKYGNCLNIRIKSSNITVYIESNVMKVVEHVDREKNKSGEYEIDASFKFDELKKDFAK